MSSNPAQLEAKHPADVKDYAINWTDLLAAESDTLATSAWTIAPSGGISVASTTTSSSRAIVWVRGGRADVDYVAANAITTTGGRTFNRSIVIPVRAR